MDEHVLRAWDNLRNERTGLLVLRTVRSHRYLSRTDIARLCSLSKTSVSEIVSKHISRGLLNETGKKDSTRNGGKRQTLLEFNPMAGLVVGIAIDVTQSTVIIVDLNANILERAVVEYAAGTSSDDVFRLIYPVIHSLIERYENKKTQLIGIGVGLPGLIDTTTGVINVADTLKGWKGLDIKSAFEEEFHVTVYVENDVKAMTLAESMFGSGKTTNDLVYLWVGYGIGAGIFLDGKLHRGVSFSAGEVGYNEVGYALSNPDEFPILYSKQGDFGNVLSDQNLINAIKNKIHNGWSSVLANTPDLSVPDILFAAEKGDELSKAALTEFSTLLSIVAINLINTLNPELLILGGQTMRPNSIVVDLVKKQLRRDLLSAPVEIVKVKAGVLDTDAVVLGAVGLVLYEFFEVPETLPYVRARKADLVF
jgi:N-acetylglucosamine repressor